MISYQALVKRPAVFQRIAGVTIAEFDVLHDGFVSAWRQSLYDTFVKGKERKRAFGGGNIPRLSTTYDLLLFILVYVRLYPLQIVQGMWFGMDESNANRWLHRLSPLLEKTLGYKHVLPKRNMLTTGKKRPRGRTLEEIIAEFPDLKDFLIDATEQQIRRPKNTQKQKEQYSGKKQRHTKKNILLTDTKKGYVHFLGRTQNGSMHDKKAADEEALVGTSDVDIGGDLGFLGYTAGNARIVLPAKKPGGKEQPVTIKEQNKVFSSIRVTVEHAIAGVKRSHIAADIYRNKKDGFDDRSMLIAAGLHNFRVLHR